MKQLILNQEPIYRIRGYVDYKSRYNGIISDEFEEFFVKEPIRKYIVGGFMDYASDRFAHAEKFLELDVEIDEVYTNPELFESVYMTVGDAHYDLLDEDDVSLEEELNALADEMEEDSKCDRHGFPIENGA
jgi:hypothetical protein